MRTSTGSRSAARWRQVPTFTLTLSVLSESPPIPTGLGITVQLSSLCICIRQLACHFRGARRPDSMWSNGSDSSISIDLASSAPRSEEPNGLCDGRSHTDNISNFEEGLGLVIYVAGALEHERLSFHIAAPERLGQSSVAVRPLVHGSSRETAGAYSARFFCGRDSFVGVGTQGAHWNRAVGASHERERRHQYYAVALVQVRTHSRRTAVDLWNGRHASTRLGCRLHCQGVWLRARGAGAVLLWKMGVARQPCAAHARPSSLPWMVP